MTRLLALPLLLVACNNDQGFGQYQDVTGGDGPEIEVSPPQLDFGALAAGESLSQTFTITNVGAEGSTLEVSEVTIGGEAGGFTILNEDTTFSIPSGTSETVEVVFTPEGANEQIAEAIVASDDEDEKRVTVDLLGEGRVPELEISPDPLDLGTAYVGCDKDHDLTLTNVGTDALIIDSINLGGDAGFALTDPNVLPLTLAPEESTTVNVSFTPTEEGDFESQVVVTSNEPIGTRTATQTATGAYAGDYEDEFEVPVNPPADIIFFVDQSCSMDDDARNLGSNFSAFIDQLSLYTSNWHIIVVNDDDGCNHSGVLQSTTTDYESRFVSAVSSHGNGSFTEAGLTVTSRAVDQTDAGECNANFLRGSALLHIIMVSDEPEQSPRPWEGYVNEVIAKKGDASLVKFSAVAGPDPGGCSSAGNSAEAGTGYSDAVNATGGEFLSICSNWSSSVEALADASVTVADFALEYTPVESTIHVFVNGTERSGGWTYDAASNSIVFDAARLPEEGDTVTVTYAGLATCD